HVVDLDGARGLVGSNLSQLREIAGKIELPIQFGGGLRNMEAVHAAFDAGADRIILGTAGLADRPFLIRCLEKDADQVIVSVDSRAGVAAIGGWEEDSGLSTDDALRNLRDLGVSRFVVSDIERDGTLTGPALEQIQAAGELLDDFIYSGGVSALADLEAIAEAAPAALNGVIVGSALFERVFTIGEAHEALAGATRQVGEEPRSDAL
ncbi:MAG: 1-(5-phosphoribosyl)-5-[(5-phosphoribosylamino)methylideneamino]imidazole-4-carboxamide isomerase, partial [Actinobacteria bacterium]|nr:1-(5-phosphoribosyl)-5-[(5-phosphoribosylamino)methylideneamino]imidazole-4-carboxamide isomerase [Actinomycetota bacterium]